jgi:hypothetical protein
VTEYGLDGREIGVDPRQRQKNFPLASVSRPALGASSLLYNGYRGSFPEAIVQPGRDANHSPPSSAEVKNEWELYPLSAQAPPWRVVGLKKGVIFICLLL